jgi:hypothetical protein
VPFLRIFGFFGLPTTCFQFLATYSCIVADLPLPHLLLSRSLDNTFQAYNLGFVKPSFYDARSL